MKRLSVLALITRTGALFAQVGDPDFNAGLVALHEEQHPTAIAAFSRSVQGDPGNARAWYYRGLSRDASGDHAGALGDLDHALLLEPGDANMLLRRADVLLSLDRPTDARRDLDLVLTRYPEGPIAIHALFSLGHAGVISGDHAQALAAYDRLIELAPNDARALCDRGIVLGHLQRHSDALNDLDRAIQLDASLQQAYVARALALIALDRKADACPDLVKAVDLGDPSVQELLLIYCDRQGP